MTFFTPTLDRSNGTQNRYTKYKNQRRRWSKSRCHVLINLWILCRMMSSCIRVSFMYSLSYNNFIEFCKKKTHIDIIYIETRMGVQVRFFWSERLRHLQVTYAMLSLCASKIFRVSYVLLVKLTKGTRYIKLKQRVVILLIKSIFLNCNRIFPAWHIQLIM